MKRKLIVTMIVFLSYISSLTGCTINGANDAINSAVSLTSEKADAYRVSCDLVRDQLDAPSKAIFPTYSSSYISEKNSDDDSYDTMYMVKAYVEAENIFGGTVKVNWETCVYPTNDGDFYVILDYIE